MWVRLPPSVPIHGLPWRNWQTLTVESRVDESSSLSGSTTTQARVVQLAGDGSFKNCTVLGSNPAASTILIVEKGEGARIPIGRGVRLKI